MGTNKDQSPWKMGQNADPDSTPTLLKAMGEGRKDAGFYTALFSTSNPASPPGGIFANAFRPGSSMDVFIQAHFHPGQNGIVAANLGAVRSLSENMMNSTFAGCVDCNKVMSFPNLKPAGHIYAIFEALFPTARADDFDIETMTHYIMLCGALDRRDLVQVGTKINFKIHDSKKDSWCFRYITMWCALQILLCQWHIAETRDEQRHHLDYILTGVMDFYMSLWFFAMHQVFFRQGGLVKLEFHAFHFYYSSILPLNENNKLHMNLSRYVLPDNTFTSKRPDNLDGMQQHMKDIYDCMMDAWTRKFRPLSDVILSGTVGFDGFAYYCKVNQVIQIDQAMMVIPIPLTIEKFIDKLTPYWYWLHFKNITLRLIAHLCEDYKDQLPLNPSTARTLWFQWCRQLDARAAVLSVRFYMQARREWMERRRLECIPDARAQKAPGVRFYMQARREWMERRRLERCYD
jgi:hypothetical protein